MEKVCSSGILAHVVVVLVLYHDNYLVGHDITLDLVSICVLLILAHTIGCFVCRCFLWNCFRGDGVAFTSIGTFGRGVSTI